MPTYEYECQKCGHTFEKFQSMKDDPLKRCPECRGALKRLFGTGAGIIFKGSGFYETDYRSSEYKSAATRDQSTSKTASSGDSSSKKSDTKKSDTKKPKSDSSASGKKSKKTPATKS